MFSTLRESGVWLHRLGLAAGVLTALPISFIALSFVKIFREHALVPKDTSKMALGLSGHSFGRRLDDPSFWAVIATAIASVCVYRAIVRMWRDYRDQVIQRTDVEKLDMRPGWLWPLTAIAIVSVYMTAVFFQNGTFFYESAERAPPYAVYNVDPILVGLQTIEGWVNIIAIVLGSIFFPYALRIRRTVIERRLAGQHLDIQTLALINAGIAPLIMMLIVRSNLDLLRLVMGEELVFFPELGWLKGLAAMLLLVWPMLVVAALTIVGALATGRYEPTVHTAWVWVYENLHKLLVRLGWLPSGSTAVAPKIGHWVVLAFLIIVTLIPTYLTLNIGLWFRRR